MEKTGESNIIDRSRVERLDKQMASLTNDATPQRLKELSRSEFAVVRTSVAEHPNTDRETLIYLSSKYPEDPSIRAGVTQNLLRRNLDNGKTL